jgi:hypothetical protein
MVMMGVIVGVGVRHGRTLYYNITGVHVLAAAWAGRLSAVAPDAAIQGLPARLLPKKAPANLRGYRTLSLTMTADLQNQFRAPIDDTVARIMRVTTSV